MSDGTRGPLDGAVFGAIAQAYRVEGGVVTLTAVVSRRTDGNRLNVIGVGPSTYSELQLLVRERGAKEFVEIRGQADDTFGVLWQHWEDYSGEVDPSKVEAIRLRAAPQYVVTMNVAARPNATVDPSPRVERDLPGALGDTVELDAVPLAGALRSISRYTNRPISLDSALLASPDFDPRQPVTVKVPEGLPLKEALDLLGAAVTPKLVAREAADGFRLVPAAEAGGN